MTARDRRRGPQRGKPFASTWGSWTARTTGRQSARPECARCGSARARGRTDGRADQPLHGGTEGARVAELADARDLGSRGATRAGSTPAPRTKTPLSPTGRDAPDDDADATQAGQCQEVASATPADLGTMPTSADTSCGRPENTTGTQPEHNRSTTADADLAAVVNAWPTLPDPVRLAIGALVKTAKS